MVAERNASGEKSTKIVGDAASSTFRDEQIKKVGLQVNVILVKETMESVCIEEKPQVFNRENLDIPLHANTPFHLPSNYDQSKPELWFFYSI